MSDKLTTAQKWGIGLSVAGALGALVTGVVQSRRREPERSASGPEDMTMGYAPTSAPVTLPRRRVKLRAKPCDCD